MENLAISHDYVLSAFDYQDGNLIRKTGRVNEIGQIAGLINEIKPAGEIVKEIITEFKLALEERTNEKYLF